MSTPEAEPTTAPTRRLSRRARRVLRDLHQRTWELEFLVSGALAFALGQLPGRVDDAFNRIFPRLTEGFGATAMIGYQYVKLILYTLIVAFLLHITLRAFWVSLVGLDSVFPRGVRWERMRLGPISRAYLRRHLPSVRELIVRTDGVASVVFSGAFYIVAVFLLSVVMVAVGTFPILAAASILPWSPNPALILIVVALVISAAITLPAVIDRVWADRIDPNGGIARWIRRSHRFNLRIGLGLYGPTQYTLSTQLGTRRAASSMAGALFVLLGLFIVRDVLVQGDRLRWSSMDFVPAIPGAAGVDPRYYEAYWDDRPNALVMPSIPVEVLDEETTYVRLFVPFRPTRDPAVIEALCPTLSPLSRSGFRLARPARGLDADVPASAIAASLDCAAELWDVDVDGIPSDAGPVFATHPRSELSGLSWYIDVRSLDPGRHVVNVRRSMQAHEVDADGDEEAAGEPRRHHQIPFWR